MKRLIFIPFQDYADFSNTHIMTREYAILKLFIDMGYELYCSVLKPRTILDYKPIKSNCFNKQSFENTVYEKLSHSLIIPNRHIFSIKQILKKRCWWKNGYNYMTKFFNENDYSDCVVYCNNPFAVDLLNYLHKKGCKTYFDIMDNFAIHPSFRVSEKKCSYKCYIDIFKFANCISANSEQTRDYYKSKTTNEIILAKNGVFEPLKIELPQNIKELIDNKKTNYKKIIGYVGKIGKRVDFELLNKVIPKCSDFLFVIIGPILLDQKNALMKKCFAFDNVLYLSGINSEYVISFLNICDCLMIPHSVGENENGGDPLKLYQYLLTRKPIITTSIIGVDEFKDKITITNDYLEWVDFFNKNDTSFIAYDIPEKIYWDYRFKEIFRIIGDEK